MGQSFVGVPPSGAAALAPDARSCGPVSSRGRAERLLLVSALSIATVAGAGSMGPLLGMHIPVRTLVVLALGAIAVDCAPKRALEMSAGVGLLALATTNWVYAGYHLILVLALFLARRRTLALVFVLATFALVVPKHLFGAHYNQPGFYNWLNEPSLTLVLFATACWWRERRDGRLPAGSEEASLPTWALLFLFPAHAANPMVYGPGDLFRERRFDPPGVLVALGLVTSKALAHVALWRCFPGWGYGGLDVAHAAALSRLHLWGIVLFNYVDLALTLSGTADVAVMLARLYGWPLASPFRFALLAWSPVELWRRWGLYNRKLLLKLVYFPLGGSTRRRLLNVMLTFLGSALLLHSGWFGSKYWTVGPGGWRDESVYFLLQGLAVCVCLVLRRTRDGRGDTGPDRRLRWSWGRVAGTVATQGSSALIHVVVLAQALPFSARFGVIARCLGLTR